MIEFRVAALAAAMVVATAAVPALAQQGGRDAAPPQTPGAGTQPSQLSDAMVQKVGKALRHAATIRQQYSERAQSTSSPEQQQALTERAQTDMVKAISDEGLSVQQYNHVIQMAQADPTLKQRLLSAAQSGE
jgi:uncharacterized protein DUF4168